MLSHLLCFLSIVANFRNLTYVPLNADSQQSSVSLALLNAQSVGCTRKWSAINDFIVEKQLDLFFITETWLRQNGDEPKCLDLCFLDTRHHRFHGPLEEEESPWSLLRIILVSCSIRLSPSIMIPLSFVMQCYVSPIQN